MREKDTERERERERRRKTERETETEETCCLCCKENKDIGKILYNVNFKRKKYILFIILNFYEKEREIKKD